MASQLPPPPTAITTLPRMAASLPRRFGFEEADRDSGDAVGTAPCHSPEAPLGPLVGAENGGSGAAGGTGAVRPYGG